VRVDSLYEYENKRLPDMKYDSIKRSRKLIVALDYPMPDDEIANVTRQVGNIAQLRTFYNDLIRIALDFPTVYIVIKGKGTESYRSPYIEDIIKKIENIDVEFDLDTYNPSYLIEKADLTIACQTSLADELLAAGRSVVLYDLSDYLNTFFNYGNLPIIVSNYSELRYHVDNFVNEIYLDAAKIRRIQKELYSDCYHGHVSKDIRAILEKVLLEENQSFNGALSGNTKLR
jgi:hypothetical protein